MVKNKKNIIIAILCIGLLCTLGYMLYNHLNGSKQKDLLIAQQYEEIKAEFATLQEHFEKNLDLLKDKNSELFKVKKEMDSFMKKDKLNEQEIKELKQKMKKINSIYINELIEKNKALVIQNDSVILTIDGLNNELNTKTSKFNNLEKEYTQQKLLVLQKDTVLKYVTNLSVSAFNASTWKVRNSGKEILTNKASRVDRILLNLGLKANPFIKKDSISLQIIVTDPNGKKLFFGNESKQVGSSAIVAINYFKNKTSYARIELDKEKFIEGIYIIEVYHKNKLIANNSIELF